MSKPKDHLETIDLAKLETVAGGKSRASSSSGDDSSAVMSALTGILDSLSSLAKQQNGGMSAADFMLAFMMMSQRSTPGVVSQHAPAPSWTWDANNGYWIVK